MHQRVRPRRHRFVYRVAYLLLDLDRLTDLDRRLRWFSVNRPNLISFFDRDHGPRDGGPLRPWVEARLAENGIEASDRILLLCMPRYLGYVFNPLSIFFCYGRDGRLAALVHEVKNTFGEQHAYVLAVEGRPAGSSIRQTCAKEFYVSPFIAMGARYRFEVEPPGERLSVVIKEHVGAPLELLASLTGRRRPISDWHLLGVALGHPLLTQKVFAAILWEALWLWLKGLALQPRPRREPAA